MNFQENTAQEIKLRNKKPQRMDHRARTTYMRQLKLDVYLDDSEIMTHILANLHEEQQTVVEILE